MRIVAYYHEEIDGNVTRKSVGLDKRETVVDEPCVLEREALEWIAELEGALSWHEEQLNDIGELRAELAALKAQVPVAWRYKERHDDMRSSWLYVPRRGLVIEGHKFQPLYAAPVVSAEQQWVPDIDAMVSRFLSWPLPADVCADQCASMQGYPHRAGTNLLNAEQAKQMLLHVFAAAPAPSTTEGKGDE